MSRQRRHRQRQLVDPKLEQVQHLWDAQKRPWMIEYLQSQGQDDQQHEQESHEGQPEHQQEVDFQIHVGHPGAQVVQLHPCEQGAVGHDDHGPGQANLCEHGLCHKRHQEDQLYQDHSAGEHQHCRSHLEDEGPYFCLGQSRGHQDGDNLEGSSLLDGSRHLYHTHSP